MVESSKPKVLIGGVIRQTPAVLKEYLASLVSLALDDLEVRFGFIDDNTDAESSRLLQEFKAGATREVSIVKVQPAAEDYRRDEITHRWTRQAMSRVGRFKDQLIETAIAEDRHLFLVDSDLILHPWTLQQLWVSERLIVATLFWTQWQPDEPFLPQVWLTGQYTLFTQNCGENLAPDEIGFRTDNFLKMLRQPGLYEVGGLGACTLIRHAALVRGVRYRELPNLDYVGEDRHFCVRAAALGIGLYVDTQLPAYHVYRESDLAGVALYREKCQNSVVQSLLLGKTPQTFGPQSALTEKRRVRPSNRLTLVMLVRNEADRLLERMLEQTCPLIDAAVILDDASTDGTADLFRRQMEQHGIPLLFQRNSQPGFHNEIALRKQVWNLAVSTDPDWLLFLDADEMFEERARRELRSLLSDSRWDAYSFRLYDLWDEQHYREDQYWRAHWYYRHFLLRYQPEYEYEWSEQPLHCGRVPKNVAGFPGTISQLRVKHYGWSDPAARRRKYEFYTTRDPEGRWGLTGQYQSILDPAPNLIPWEE